MITTQHTRVTASSTAIGALVAVLSLQAFGRSDGVQVPAPAPVVTPAVRELVDQQEATGLRCRVEPALTDRVVVQYTERAAQVVTFDLAVEATRDGTGVIARYCA